MGLPDVMTAVRLSGYGGLDKLEYRMDVPTPRPGAGEVVVRVTAAGLNNTDINTRTGWYNSAVQDGTTEEGGVSGFAVSTDGMGDWAGDIAFPRIQGADCVGRIAVVGEGVAPQRLGERVVCDPYVYDPDDPDWLEKAGFLGAEFDGAFAQFTRLSARNAIHVRNDLPVSDAQLATLPRSGGTAMNMMLMAGLHASDVVLVTGASGGVGTFLIQIAKHYSAEVVAVCSASALEALQPCETYAECLAVARHTGMGLMLDEVIEDQESFLRAARDGILNVAVLKMGCTGGISEDRHLAQGLPEAATFGLYDYHLPTVPVVSNPFPVVEGRVKVAEDCAPGLGTEVDGAVIGEALAEYVL
ncbi:MAG: alcohol dehydrogenase catalytic domain-containing protein [Pseudomonadota bacterium]